MNHFRFTTIITQEDAHYIARCVEVGVVSQGISVEEAMNNLKEAVDLYFEATPREELRQYSSQKVLVGTLDVNYA